MVQVDKAVGVKVDAVEEALYFLRVRAYAQLLRGSVVKTVLKLRVYIELLEELIARDIRLEHCIVVGAAERAVELLRASDHLRQFDEKHGSTECGELNGNETCALCCLDGAVF